MKCQMTCICSGRGFIFVGDDFGRIHFINRRMDVQTVKLFEGNIEQIVQVINSSIFLLEDTTFENYMFCRILKLAFFTLGTTN